MKHKIDEEVRIGITSVDETSTTNSIIPEHDRDELEDATTIVDGSVPLL